MSTTFVSYSQDSPWHKDAVRGLVTQLRESGVDCMFDQDIDNPEEGWPTWMLHQIRDSQFVVVVCSEGYLAKFDHLAPAGKGVKWEGSVITQELYESEGRNSKFIPVVFSDADTACIPAPLRPYTYYHVIESDRYVALVNRLLGSALGEGGQERSAVRRGVSSRSDHVSGKPASAPVINQNSVGSENIQIGKVDGNFTIKTSSSKKPTVFMAPAEGTIKADPFIEMRITEMFNTLGQEREKRFGKSAYSVMYRNFKNDFGIGKDQKWTVIWQWPDTAAPSIINYLDGKIANTIAGRKEGAANRGNRLPSRGNLYAREKELLSHLDLEVSSPSVHDALNLYFGVKSHTKLTHHQHWLWVCRLDQQVRMAIGEDPTEAN